MQLWFAHCVRWDLAGMASEVKGHVARAFDTSVQGSARARGERTLVRQRVCDGASSTCRSCVGAIG
jgi:hypothetical protein